MLKKCDALDGLADGMINHADAVYLESFARHGKLILYHGLSDQGLSPLDTVAWYERARAQSSGPSSDRARLFLVPGMTHCAGGPATDRFDMLTAIDEWVEHGQPPERIIATGKAFPGLSRQGWGARMRMRRYPA